MDFDEEVNKIGRRKARAFFAKRLAIVLVLISFAGIWRGCGWHIVRAPTAAELYGCTVADAAPDGECQ